MKMTGRVWTPSRSEQVSSARWPSWESSELVRPSKDGNGVVNELVLPAEKVMLCAVGSWFNSSEVEHVRECTRAHQGQLQRGSC